MDEKDLDTIDLLLSDNILSDSLIYDNSRLNQQLRDTENKYQEIIKQQNKKIELLQQKIIDYENTITSLKNKLEKEKNNLDLDKLKIETTITEKKHFASRIVELEQEYQQRFNEFKTKENELIQQLKLSLEKEKELLTKNTFLQQRLNQIQNLYNDLQNKFLLLQKTKIDTYENLNMENEELKKQLSQLKNEVSIKDNLIQTIETESNKKINELQNAIENLKSELSEKVFSIEQKNREIEAYKSQAVTLERDFLIMKTKWDGERKAYENEFKRFQEELSKSRHLLEASQDEWNITRQALEDQIMFLKKSKTHETTSPLDLQLLESEILLNRIIGRFLPDKNFRIGLSRLEISEILKEAEAKFLDEKRKWEDTIKTEATKISDMEKGIFDREERDKKYWANIDEWLKFLPQDVYLKRKEEIEKEKIKWEETLVSEKKKSLNTLQGLIDREKKERVIWEITEADIERIKEILSRLERLTKKT